MSYRAPKSPARVEQEVKKSRFIGIAVPVRSEEDVEAALSSLRGELPDATHHCWAYLLGDPDGNPRMRFDDAGEPSGTAGRPILQVLQHRSVGNALVVVVRFFGGVKLGAGGLVRAYSSTASRTLDEVELVEVTPRLELLLRADYPDEQLVRRILARRGHEILSVQYGEAVAFTVRVPQSEEPALSEELANATRGRATSEPSLRRNGWDIVSGS